MFCLFRSLAEFPSFACLLPLSRSPSSALRGEGQTRATSFPNFTNPWLPNLSLLAGRRRARTAVAQAFSDSPHECRCHTFPQTRVQGKGTRESAFLGPGMGSADWFVNALGLNSPFCQHTAPPAQCSPLKINYGIHHQKEADYTASRSWECRGSDGHGLPGITGYFCGGSLTGKPWAEGQARPGTRKQQVFRRFGRTPVAYERGWALLPDTLPVDFGYLLQKSSSFRLSLTRVWRWEKAREWFGTFRKGLLLCSCLSEPEKKSLWGPGIGRRKLREPLDRGQLSSLASLFLVPHNRLLGARRSRSRGAPTTAPALITAPPK